MRIGQINQGRPAYYDRNAVSRVQSYSAAGIAPHVTTQRWGYTVPSNTKAFVQSSHCGLMRTAVAAPVNIHESSVSLIPNGGSVAVIVHTPQQTNGVGDRDHESTGSIGILLPGDVLAGNTADASTGGTVNYDTACSIMEFDS